MPAECNKYSKVLSWQIGTQLYMVGAMYRASLHNALIGPLMLLRDRDTVQVTVVI